MISKTHHFFVLPLSPWPLISSIGAFNLALSLLLYFKFNLLLSFVYNLINITFCSFLWWLHYGSELNKTRQVSFSLDSGLKTSMILFISSEVLFFFSFFWAYFHFFLSPSMETGLFWPPMEVVMFNSMNVPLINTVLLLSSGLCTTISHHYLNVSNKISFLVFLILAISLGALFSFFQLVEYMSAFFSVSDSNFGSSFFLLTGFHGLHVIIGSIFLSVSMFRSINLDASSESSVNFEMAAWYWHFVDVVWIFLYFLIYYLNY